MAGNLSDSRSLDTKPAKQEDPVTWQSVHPSCRMTTEQPAANRS